MIRLKRPKLLALLLPLGALLLVLGVSQTASLPSRVADRDVDGTGVCTQPSKIFRFTLDELERGRVSALKIRIFPEADLAQLSFAPHPEEILLDRDGTVELRYPARALLRAPSVQVELCAASPAHEVREAYWIVREDGKSLAKLVKEEEITWEWRESGRKVVPGTRRLIKELSCAGEVLVSAYQPIGKDQPLCVKDTAALAKLQRQLDELQRERSSFLGRLKVLLFGEGEYERRMAAISSKMERLFIYSPYEGLVLGVAYDELNDLTWVKLQVEEPSGIYAAP